MAFRSRHVVAPIALAGLLASCGGDDPAPTDPVDETSPQTDPPVLSLSTDSVHFEATAGGDDAPSARTVSVTNAGGGSLEGLTVDVSYSDGETDGWLTATLSSTSEPATITLQPGVGAIEAGTYDASVAVQASAASNGPESVVVTLLVNPGPPAAPSNLAATAVSASAIDLGWTDHADNENGFRIERCEGSDCDDFTALTTVDPDTEAHEDTGLDASTTYRYRVQAFGEAGASDFSNVVEATTEAAPADPPAAPSDLSATPSISSVKMSWTDNATDEVGYRIERCETAGCDDFAEVATVDEDQAFYKDTGLSASTTYRYRVRAYNAAGESAYSNTVSATTDSEATTGSLRVYTSTTGTDIDPTGYVVEVVSGGLGRTLNLDVNSFATFPDLAEGSATVSLDAVASNCTVTNGSVHTVDIVAGEMAEDTFDVACESAETEETYYPAHDNLLMSGSADPDLADTVYQDAILNVGCNFSYSAVGTFEYVCAASAIEFDVQSDIGGKTILDATLTLEQLALPGDFDGTFKLAAIASGWNPSTITWNVWLGMSYYTGQVFDFEALASVDVPLEFDVTTIVQNWADGTLDNYGFQIWDPDPVPPGYEAYQAIPVEARLDIRYRQ